MMDGEALFTIIVKAYREARELENKLYDVGILFNDSADVVSPDSIQSILYEALTIANTNLDEDDDACEFRYDVLHDFRISAEEAAQKLLSYGK